MTIDSAFDRLLAKTDELVDASNQTERACKSLHTSVLRQRDRVLVTLILSFAGVFFVLAILAIILGEHLNG